MPTILERLFRHNVWANLNLLEVCADLTQEQLDTAVPGTYGTIRDTWLHLAGAEESFLAAVTGERPASRVRHDELPGFADLRERLRRSGDGFVAFASRCHEDDILCGERSGQPFAIPLSTFLIQVVNHATEHRSQIMTIVTQLGIQPPDLDGWSYDAACPLNEWASESRPSHRRLLNWSRVRNLITIGGSGDRRVRVARG